MWLGTSLGQSVISESDASLLECMSPAFIVVYVELGGERETLHREEIGGSLCAIPLFLAIPILILILI